MQLEALAADKAEGQQREQLLQNRIHAVEDSLKQAYDRANRARGHHERFVVHCKSFTCQAKLCHASN